MQKRYREAEDECRKALALDSKYAHAYSNLGAVYHIKGNFDEAEDLYKKAVELAPREGEFHNRLCKFFFIRKRYPEAEVACNKAGEVDPNLTAPHRILGDIYSSQERREEALKEYGLVMFLSKQGEAIYEYAQKQINALSVAHSK